MIPAEVYRQVRRLRLRVRRAVRAGAGGSYRSAFRGSGLLFEDVRAYEPGDDVRFIDWNVTARLGTPYVKRYVEERELTVFVVLDLSDSMRLGTGRHAKSAVAAELASVLLLLAAAHQDRAGWLGVSGDLERVAWPGKGGRLALSRVRDILTASSRTGGTNLAKALEYLAARQRQRAVIFLISDFLIAPNDRRLGNILGRVARQHDVAALEISDPVEDDWPEAGLVRVADAETGRATLVDSGSAEFRAAFRARAEARRAELAAWLAQLRVGHERLTTSGDHFGQLTRYLRARSHSRRDA